MEQPGRPPSAEERRKGTVNHEDSSKDDALPQTWGDRAWRAILAPLDPHGNPIETPADRRWLWLLAREIDTSGDEETWRLVRDLNSYLSGTCVHHWLSYGADEYMPAHRQCLWCNLITSPAGPGEQGGAQDDATEGQ
jgi:hypothetical protein